MKKINQNIQPAPVPQASTDTLPEIVFEEDKPQVFPNQSFLFAVCGGTNLWDSAMIFAAIPQSEFAGMLREEAGTQWVSDYMDMHLLPTTNGLYRWNGELSYVEDSDGWSPRCKGTIRPIRLSDFDEFRVHIEEEPMVPDQKLKSLQKLQRDYEEKHIGVRPEPDTEQPFGRTDTTPIRTGYSTLQKPTRKKNQ